MDYDNIFPTSTANQITEEYYNFLVGEMNRGTTKLKVQKVLHRNGSYIYFTYHLVNR